MNSREKDFLSDETMLLSEISDDDLKEFGLLETLESRKKSSKASIISFHEIGWIDPFPKLPIPKPKKKSRRGATSKKQTAPAKVAGMTESKQMALQYLDAIDDVECMKPILSLALPSRILLFKIMRACIAVRKPEDLWMYVQDGV